MLFDGSDTVGKCMFCTIINVKYGTFCMKQQFSHGINCNETLMADFNSIPNLRVLDRWPKFLRNLFC